MAGYFKHVRETLTPELTQPATMVLQRYYSLMRQSIWGLTNRGRCTIRMLESLIRLSVAHAKLMYRRKVLLVDTIVAIDIMDSTTQPRKTRIPQSEDQEGSEESKGRIAGGATRDFFE